MKKGGVVMIQILGRASIGELSQFMGVFATRGARMRRQYGCSSASVYKVAGEGNEVVLLFAWESRERFEEFLADPQVKETMKSGGTQAPPAFTFLEEVGNFPG